MAELVVSLPRELAGYETDLKVFLGVMIQKLAENAYKGRWENVDVELALNKLSEEIDEVHDALIDGDVSDITSESADVANTAMILALVLLKGVPNPFEARIKRGNGVAFVKWAAEQDIEECIIWPFRSKTGPNMEYASVSKNFSKYGRRAHRVVCGLKHGDPPTPEHEAAHICGNSLCLNPNHIRWATRSENEQDKKLVGTHFAPKKLSPTAAHDIRQQWREGATVTSIAKRYNVSAVSIYRVINGESYWEKPDGNT